MKPQVTDWNQLAGIRPPSWFTRVYFHNQLHAAYRRLLRHAALAGPLAVIELGAGTGYTSLCLAHQFCIEQLVLVDNSPAMLSVARQVLAPAGCLTEFRLQDLTTYDPTEQFDLVHSSGVLEHFPAPARHNLLRLHASLAKPGGYCILFVPTPTVVYRAVRRLAELLGIWPFYDETPLSAAQLIAEIRAAGLEVLASTLLWSHHLPQIGVLARNPG